MAYENPLKLELKPDLQEDCEQFILRNVRETVAAHKTRNEDFYRWRDMLHGIPQGQSESAWENSCQIEDGLFQEQRNQALAPMLKPLSSFPLAMVDEVRLADKEKAQYIEQWGSQVMQQEGFVPAFRYYVDSCISYPWGVFSTTWKVTEQQKRGVRYWDRETIDESGEPTLLRVTEREATVDYQTIPVLEPDTTTSGIEFTCIPAWDLFLSPPDAPSIEASSAVMERRRWTDNDLLNGIEEYGFDRKKVYEAIRFCSNELEDEERSRYRETWGLEEEATSFKQGECFLWYGYLPKLYDAEGDPQLPKYLWNDLFCAVVYPMANMVLKLDFSPYLDYPYDSGTLLGEVGTPYGMALGPMLEAYQQEATHYRRVAANTADLIASPPIVMYNNAWELNKAQTLYPGAIFRGEMKGDLEFPSFPTAPNVVSTSMLDYTRNRAQALTAAQGFGQVNQKQPLVAEMEGVMAATDVKFDLFASSIYSIVPKIMKRILKLYLQFQPDFQSLFLMEGAEVSLSAEELASQYEFSVASLNQNASEQARIQRDAAILRIQNEYFGYIAQTFGGPLAFTQPAKWTASRDALSHLSVRKPEQYLLAKPPEGGYMPPPPQGDPAMLLEGIMAQLQGGGGSGNVASNGARNGQPGLATSGR